jgi:hypothetical protein
MSALTITTAFDLDTGRFAIFCESSIYPGVSPAGPRILRGQPHPDIQFSHEDEDACNRDAQKLRDYLAGLKQKEPSKKAVRAVGA